MVLQFSLDNKSTKYKDLSVTTSSYQTPTPSAPARLLGLWVRIPQGAWLSVSY